jgi:hypothetical protein
MQSTIDDLFAKADAPQNITVGCFVQETNDEAPLITNVYSGRVKVKTETPGSIFSVCKCRNNALSLITNEDYVLQTDSHMRFDYGWDSYLINLYKELPNKSLISVYLPDWYVNESNIEIIDARKNTFANFTFNDKNSKQAFIKYNELVPMREQDTIKTSVDYKKGWYLCGHFIFGSATFFKNIPQPEWVGFWGEEVINSLRAFSSGWDVYIPGNPPIYHLNASLSVDVGRPKLWIDYPYEHQSMRIPTTKKIINIIKNNTVGENELFSFRSLNKLYELIGYNLSNLFSEWETEVWPS